MITRYFSEPLAHSQAQTRQRSLQKLLFDGTRLIFSTPLKHSSEDFISSGEKPSTKIIVVNASHFHSFPLKWKNEFSNISHMHNNAFKSIH